MIQNLDDTLKELLIQKLPNSTQYDIKFELPNGNWEATVQNPTVNFFLYDIRENLELRSNETFLQRYGNTGKITREPIRMDFSYMITVWTKEVGDEHCLLGDILKTLLRYPLIPPEVLKGEMSDLSPPLRAWVSQPERIPNGWEFWSALDVRLKAGLSYVVTVPVQPFTPTEVPLVTETTVTVRGDNI
ncbi:hypothetical protein NIES4071_05720 [Calothrix sp. NIES-4071]|nr:hypothetical protein NIES4071_05720 [Calothrix sp. NIES-4071]BAZ54917.1 hypothetical protein NIES4105_05710 [Calothrix sp. NIES-4105]